MSSQFPLLFMLLWLRLISAAILQRVIDDTFGDEATGVKPVYSPPQAWRSGCVSCAFGDRYGNPENYTYRQTWSTSTYIPGADPSTIQISFRGGTISLYFVLFNFPPTSAQFPTQTKVNFTIDGVPPTGYFEHIPDADQAPVLTQPVKLVGLSNADHKLLISASGPEAVLIDFDYAIYEYDDSYAPSSQSPSPSPSTSPSSTSPSSESAHPSSADSPITNQGKTNIVLIAGSVAGGVAVILVAAIGLYCCRRRRLARGRSNFSIDDEEPPMAAQHTGSIIPFIDAGVNAPGAESLGIPSVLRNPNSAQNSPPLASPYKFPAIYRSQYPMNEERHSSIPHDLNRTGFTKGAPDGTSQYASGASAYAASGSLYPLSIPSSSSAGKMERQLLVTNQDADLNDPGDLVGRSQGAIPQTETEMLEMRQQMQLMKMQIDSLQLKQQSEGAGPSDELPPQYEPAGYDSTFSRPRGQN